MCRPLQQTLDEGARERTGSDGGRGDVPSVNTSCPLLRDSCETLCWNVLSWGVVSSDQAVNVTGLAIDAADSGLPTGAVELLSEVFEQCGASIEQF